MQSNTYFAWYAICMVCIHSCVVTAKHKITIDDPIIPQEVLDNSNYNIGVGIWDITGPAGGVGMMGYAQPSQMTNGVHFRLRARAFIFEDPTTSKRIVFVSTDSCMIFTSVKNGVVNKLQSLYGDMYIQDNVMLSGTHTHSGPAGYAFYALYNIMSFGFYEDNYQVIVNGIVQAISMAHNNLSSGGKITINSGELLNSNINRSPYAYTANPGWEKAKYKYDVDKTMTLIRLQNAQGDDIGMVNWFAVHGTSMNNTNQLISGDNKGYAAYLFEKKMNGNSSLPGVGPFVSAFAQSNEGDVSPNTKGAHCLNGLPCEVAHSTCGGTSEGCIASGPGVDMFDSTRIIGTHQFDKATELFESATTVLSGPVDYIHTFVDMTNVQVDARWTSTGTNGSTCVGALGDAFAGGTTDGPGDFDFVQGTNSSSTNPYWNMIGRFLSEPPQEQIDCQFPKPILIYAGGVDIPGPWVPAILPLQIFRLGQLFLIGVPGEFTTMSGRRLRDTVRQTLEKYGVADNNTFVVIAGLTNAYSHYITTYEEFQYQRYEGGSTLYGPHTLSAYQQEFSALAAAMAQGQTYPPGPTPPDLSSKTFHIPIPQDPDEHPIFGSYGEVYQDVQSTYSVGSTVTATFYGGNPNNDFRTQDTYLTVEQNVNGNWVVVLTDGDWDTRYTYSHDDLIYTLVTAEWIISAETVPGQYRIRVFGTAKDIVGGMHEYTGTSSTFTVSQ